MRLLARSLLARIVVSFSLLSALIVMLLAATTYAMVVRDVGRAADAQLQTLADAKEATLESWIHESRRRVEFAATMDAATLGGEAVRLLASGLDTENGRAGRLRSALVAIRARWPELGELLFASDRGGLVLASTTPSLEGQYRVADTWFVEGRKGTYVQNVYPSPVTLQPTLTVAAPVQDAYGRPLGVLAANLDLRILDQILQELTGPFGMTESYLVDRFRVLVSAERYGTDTHPRGVRSAGIDAAIEGVDGSGTYVNHRGIRVIGAHRWLDEYELALVVEVPAAEAFGRARRLAAVIGGAGILVVAILTLGVFLLARRIVAPILAVAATSHEVAAGNLAATAPLSTEDEIGVLARSFNDMTARLRALYATLQRNEERFRTLIEASSDLVALIDREGRFTFVGPAVVQLTGYTPEELEGTDALAAVHPEDASLVRELISEVLSAGTDGRTVSAEYRVRTKDGHWRVVESAVRNLLGHPSIAGLLVNTRDITERRHLEAELAQAQKMEAVGRLAGGIAHDFNNLLTAILGFAKLLSAEPELGPEAAGEVAEITAAARRAAALTQQLLAYGRKQVLDPRILDLNELVRRTETMLRRVIGEHIVMRLALGDEIRPVEADPGQLERVIVNLAVNARDAMPEGGTLTIGTLDVVLGPDDVGPEHEIDPGPYVLLTVADTGAGMDQGILERLFEPFSTTKPVGQGTGLGLATVYGIVRQSGGRVTVESRPGCGTTFRIYLPPAHARPATLPANDTPRSSRGSESILIVEDEQAVAALMREALIRAGYRVHVARGPDEALQLADAEARADLLVTDVVMPGMDGRQLAERLRERHPALQVLFVSGYPAADVPGRETPFGELSFLQKPFTPAALAYRVREILDRVRS